MSYRDITPLPMDEKLFDGHAMGVSRQYTYINCILSVSLYTAKFNVKPKDMAKLVVEFVEESNGKPRPAFQMGTIEYLDRGLKYDFTIMIPYHESPELGYYRVFVPESESSIKIVI
ncbi:uncharacterized protein MELLADRAFT_59774 [Melampsora larici-populina 98AG31]|uniref:Uncharacterized protein n=1 Tax=Melampsora larici-populina (strain 98AG31 / pathotype 3-4-7) TaxID=747676 RepID=F4R791_MELLP|nr:uncharacterized protein MELLADRAFT_59774 [Melampsora larici-populina 98AG31]EGG11560.1 hypothetical protein MELLADRAFT_59774 [Melampsora larici-populina 98AG31]